MRAANGGEEVVAAAANRRNDGRHRTAEYSEINGSCMLAVFNCVCTHEKNRSTCQHNIVLGFVTVVIEICNSNPYSNIGISLASQLTNGFAR